MRTKSIILLNALLLLLSSCGRDDEMGEFHDSPDPLPVLQINLNHSTDTISRGVYVEGLLQIPSTDISNNFDASLEIRGRGNSTWTFPKKPYQIRLEEKASILGMPDDRRWILLANYSDKSMLRNELAFDLSRMSHLHWTPDSRFIELELDNDFVGTYQLTQKVEVTDERIGIGKDGYLLEVDQLDRLAPDDVYFESENYLFNIKEPALQVGDEKYEYIQGFIQEAEAALLGPNFKDAQEGYQKYFDLEALIDWYLINEIGKNVDGDFHSSVYMNYLPGGKLKMGPIWDFDISFGNIDYHGNETTDEFYIAEGTWLSRFFEDPNFVEKVKDRYAFFYAEKENIFESIRTNASELRETQVKNYEKWPTLGIYVWPNYVYFDTYEEEVDYLIQWLEERMEWLNTAFANL